MNRKKFLFLREKTLILVLFGGGQGKIISFFVEN